MKRIITLALAGLLTACSSQMKMPSIDDILPSKDLDRTMYLRGCLLYTSDAADE